MTHKVDLIMDFQYGSTGKGLIAGYLAKRRDYDTVICAFATNAGHTYIDGTEGLHVMTQQIPTAAVVSKTIERVLIGPGALIHAATFMNEVKQNAVRLEGKIIMIHPQAAVVEDYHAEQELKYGMAKIGSTTKGVGAAAIERIHRDPIAANTAGIRWREEFGAVFPAGHPSNYVVTEEQYRKALMDAEHVIVEGAQGFGLSMYHGQYPYTTSRDVTPWQILADCGAPYRWASHVKVIGSCRTFPIRVNNRDGSSGPCYPDQKELSWDDPRFKDRGIAAELTTVTKLKRRIFTFSQQQIRDAAFHCGGYWDTEVFLNFANYCQHSGELMTIVNAIERGHEGNWNPPKVAWLGYGPDDSDVIPINDCAEMTTRIKDSVDQVSGDE